MRTNKELKEEFINLTKDMTQQQIEDMLDVFLNGDSAKCYEDNRTIFPCDNNGELSYNDVIMDMSNLYTGFSKDTDRFLKLFKKTLKKKDVKYVNSNTSDNISKLKIFQKKSNINIFTPMLSMLGVSLFSLMLLLLSVPTVIPLIISLSTFIAIPYAREIEFVSMDEFTFFRDYISADQDRDYPFKEFLAKRKAESGIEDSSNSVTSDEEDDVLSGINDFRIDFYKIFENVDRKKSRD